MKIVVAFDSLKGSLSAREACRITARTLRTHFPDAVIEEVPVGDGGEGTIDAMLGALGGTWIPTQVLGPLPRRPWVDSGFGWVSDKRLALVELATSSGLTLIPSHDRNPLLTASYGTGQAIAAALARKPNRIVIGAGGSATVDGGFGAAMALGWQFLDAEGQSIGLGGHALQKLERIVRPPALDLPETEILCDVTNPLLGPKGAAAVFGPQKGATPEMVPELESGLRRLAEKLREQLGADIADLPGGGAAGGFAGGGTVWFGARLVPGIREVLDILAFENHCRDADWVVTGEGSYDGQSLEGKAVTGVIEAARLAKPGIRTAVLAGRVDPATRPDQPPDLVLEISPRDLAPEVAMAEADRWLAKAAERLGQEIDRG